MRTAVLIVEDNVLVRESLAALLHLYGYGVLEAGNGREALTLLERGITPGLILLDLMMPVMDGWQFLAAKRNDARISAMPVAITSAVSEIEPVALDDCVVATFVKPFDVQQLVKVVAAHCRSADGT